MYLVHARLRTPAPPLLLPPGITDLMAACARREDRLEHVSVHPESGTTAVLGFWLLAGSPVHAERVALELCARALSPRGPLPGWRLVSLDIP